MLLKLKYPTVNQACSKYVCVATGEEQHVGNVTDRIKKLDTINECVRNMEF